MNENTPTPPPVPDPDHQPTEALADTGEQPTSTQTPQSGPTPGPAEAPSPSAGAPSSPPPGPNPPPSSGAGYPPSGTGYPPSGSSTGYPPGGSYPPPGTGYPPGGSFPPPGTGYPPYGAGYPPSSPGTGYPPPGSMPPPSGYGTPAGYPGAQPTRRLTRSRTDRMVGGVCGGLARYWNTDPVLLRILTVVLTLATGGAFLVGYIIAWIAIPDEPMGPYPFGQGPRADQVGYAAGGNPPYADQTASYEAPPRERSYLGWLIVSAVILVAGILGLVGFLAEPSIQFWGVLFAVLLTLIGVGLLVGTRYGRARWLVFLAVPMAFLTFGTVAAANWVQDEPNWERWSTSSGALTIGDRTWEVGRADLTGAPLTYRLSAGNATLDLTGLTGTDVLEGRRIQIDAGVGLGQLLVLLPPDMTLELASTVRAGQITVPGRDRVEGTNLALDTTIEPLSAERAGYTVTLDAAIGAGNLEVRHEAA